MKKIKRSDTRMLPEYDFSNAPRGKYGPHYAADNTIVLLDPDEAKVFPTTESVNRALRAIIEGHAKPKPSRKQADRADA